MLAEILWESRKKEKCYGNGKAVNLYSAHGDFNGMRDRPGSTVYRGKLNLDSEIGVGYGCKVPHLRRSFLC
jgi:hypothetical protein